MDKTEVDIHLEFGDDSDEKKLIEMNVEMMIGKEAV